MNKINNFIKKKNNIIKRDFWLIIIGAFIFTASFLWKDYLTDVEETFFPKSRGLLGRGIYVLVVTIILVVIAVLLKSYIGLETKTSSTLTSQLDDSPLGGTDRNIDNTNDSNGSAENFYILPKNIGYS